MAMLEIFLLTLMFFVWSIYIISRLTSFYSVVRVNHRPDTKLFQAWHICMLLAYLLIETVLIVYYEVNLDLNDMCCVLMSGCVILLVCAFILMCLSHFNIIRTDFPNLNNFDVFWGGGTKFTDIKQGICRTTAQHFWNVCLGHHSTIYCSF